jgi:hypothetical protein
VRKGRPRNEIPAPPDPFNRIKILAVEVATTVIFVYFVVKEVEQVISK